MQLKNLLTKINKIKNCLFEQENELCSKEEHIILDKNLDLGHYIKQGNFLVVHHLIRYYWALEVIKSNKKSIHNILDVACGSGYGSFLISEAFKNISVKGADYDPKAIEIAKTTYTPNPYILSNLFYSIGDILNWESTIGDEYFDCIISFDTIEHIPHRELMMENIVKFLKKDGIFLFSTPVKTQNILQPEWKHHNLEYSYASLFDFLKRYFEIVIGSDQKDFPNKDIFNRLNGSNVNYSLNMNPVVCKNPITINNPYL